MAPALSLSTATLPCSFRASRAPWFLCPCPGPPGSSASMVPHGAMRCRAMPCDAVAANVVRWMQRNGVMDTPRRLGYSVGRYIAMSQWFVPRPGVAVPGGTFRPFLLTAAGGAANPEAVDALLDLGLSPCGPSSLACIVRWGHAPGNTPPDPRVPPRHEPRDPR